MRDEHYNVIIIGGGAAGLTAGIYTSRAKLSTLIVTEGMPGGQMILTHEVANYPGVEQTSGYQIANTMKKQAESFGSKIISNIKIDNLQLEGNKKVVRLNNNQEYTADTIILATGGKPRELGVEGETGFKGRGISYCATCDGDFFQDKEIIVVGGGNSALEEADSLTKYANKVTIVHQFDNFQAFEHAVKKAKANPKIDFIMESTVKEFVGEENLKYANIINLKTQKITKLDIDGAFIFIGYVPNTGFLKGIVDLNDRKEVIVDKKLKTNIEGVYAAGDSNEKPYRQITTAVGDGTIAALSAIEYINQKTIQHY